MNIYIACPLYKVLSIKASLTTLEGGWMGLNLPPWALPFYFLLKSPPPYFPPDSPLFACHFVSSNTPPLAFQIDLHRHLLWGQLCGPPSLKIGRAHV